MADKTPDHERATNWARTILTDAPALHGSAYRANVNLARCYLALTHPTHERRHQDPRHQTPAEIAAGLTGAERMTLLTNDQTQAHHWGRFEDMGMFVCEGLTAKGREVLAAVQAADAERARIVAAMRARGDRWYVTECGCGVADAIESGVI